MSDLTKGLGKNPNYYCHNCNAHYWKGKWYTTKEWEEWINENT